MYTKCITHLHTFCIQHLAAIVILILFTKCIKSFTKCGINLAYILYTSVALYF